jgi:hypothetical protein
MKTDWLYMSIIFTQSKLHSFLSPSLYNSGYESWSYLAENKTSEHAVNITLDYSGSENIKIRSHLMERNGDILDFNMPVGQSIQFLATLHSREPNLQTNKVLTYNVAHLPVPPPP